MDTLAAMAPPLVLRRAERVRCAIGCKAVGGAGVLITLEDGAPAGGAGIGVGATITLGGDAGVVAFTLGGGAATGSNSAGVCMPALGGDTRAFANCKLGGPPSGMVKMARRLSTASSWA